MILRLALSQAPELVEGDESVKIRGPQVLQPHVLALAKPPSMSKGGLCNMREEKVVLDT
jgi:hypothetical protein